MGKPFSSTGSSSNAGREAASKSANFALAVAIFAPVGLFTQKLPGTTKNITS